jgi:DNA polymerase-3 subunit epsilon
MMQRLVARFSLRLRVFLFFALIGLGGFGLSIAALVAAGADADPAQVRALTVWGGGAAALTLGLVVWVWRMFDEHVARPIDRIGRGALAAAHGGARQVGSDGAVYLGSLAPGAQAAADALAKARAERDAAVEAATSKMARRCRQLELVLHDLEQGVIVCAADHRILLYNRRALKLLDACGDVGLGRSLFDLVVAQPFVHAMDTVQTRVAQQGASQGLSAPFVAATADGAATLQGRLTLMPDPDGDETLGYLLTFDDVTGAHADRLARDRLLREGVATVTQALERAQRGEAAALGEAREAVERFAKVAASQIAADWPMADVWSLTLFTSVIRRRTGAQRVSAEIVGKPCWLRCDTVAMVEALDGLMDRLAARLELRAFTLEAAPREGRVALILRWRGPQPSAHMLDEWRAAPLDAAVGGVTPGELLALHDAPLTVEGDGETAQVAIAAPTPAEAHAPPPPAAPARPEFYDFDLMQRPALSGLFDEAPLRDLSYVVFDTETTGLEPSRGDRMVQIAGVRIVNGRVLKGEAFDRLIHPGRRIPAASTRIHHIDDAMVADAPPSSAILPQFHAFAAGAVLVAHNAAFDMKFLSLEAGAEGPRFDQPVLDTVLLAAHLHGQSDSLTLDALAERFAVDLPAAHRHTALGDALATADVFLRLLDMLEADGVTTLGQALEVSQGPQAIRRKQAAY